jgi:uncharacterized surface protein with fasciclin (FAS1) repeats
MLKQLSFILLLWSSGVTSFLNQPCLGPCPRNSIASLKSTEEGRKATIEDFLSEKYPSFTKLLVGPNEEMLKILRGGGAFTIFVPTEEAFANLGEEKLEQLEDVRNAESMLKIGSSHVIGEPVSAEELFASGGVITLGGEVPVDRSTSGGFMGIGAKEDGGVTVNGATVLNSMTGSDGGVIHEVDALISSKMLWRYMDQLRIPGSK